MSSMIPVVVFVVEVSGGEEFRWSIECRNERTFDSRVDQGWRTEGLDLLSRREGAVIPIIRVWFSWSCCLGLEFGDGKNDGTSGSRSMAVDVRRSLWPRCRWSNVPPTAVEMWRFVVNGALDDGGGCSDIDVGGDITLPAATLCCSGICFMFVRRWMNRWRIFSPTSPSGA